LIVLVGIIIEKNQDSTGGTEIFATIKNFDFLQRVYLKNTSKDIITAFFNNH